MDVPKFRETYWNYYLQLESDFFSLEPFCTIDIENNEAFSVKYLQCLLAICGELDTILKKFCKKLDSSLDINHCSIVDYKRILMNKYPKISKEIVTIDFHIYGKICPFDSWNEENEPLSWWKTYNKVKHHRDEIWKGKESYKHANQKSVIEALAALYVIEEYWTAYNFVWNNGWQENHIMEIIKSTRMTLENWKVFFRGYVGSKRFDANACRACFNFQE